MVAAAAGVIASAGGAGGQPAEEPAEEPAADENLIPPELLGTPPPGFRRYEVIDMTLGMRDDGFNTITIDPRDGTVYVGTRQGRFYRSLPEDTFWDESTVVPEVKNLYGFAGQKVLFGSLRSDGANVPGSVRFTDGRPKIEDLPNPLVGKVGAPRELQLAGPLRMPDEAIRPVLEQEAEGASGAAGGTLGVGLSARAPRLSLLLGAWRRTVPVISMTRMLATSAVRSPAVWRIVPHPTDESRIYVGTAYGLYMSRDGGVSFVRAFPGLSKKERGITQIVVDPTDPDKVYMGTTRGLFVSTDRGDNWQKHTRVPDVRVQAMAIDPTDPDYIYIGSNSGVFRSTDGGDSFLMAFYSTLRKRRNIGYIEIDPFDPNTVYLATRDGVMMTTNAREGGSDEWTAVAGLRTVNLNVPVVRACTRHRGHLYIMTRADLRTINYGAHGPEAYLVESWDRGDTWRVLMGNRTQGDIRWFTLDPENPDRVYVAFKRAIVRLERTGDRPPARAGPSVVAREGPPMTDVLAAALEHHGLRLDVYNDMLHSYEARSWIPRVTVEGFGWRRRVTAVYDDAQFADDRFLGLSTSTNWGVMAWATWNLPDVVHKHQAHAMIKLRVNVMNDEVRNQIMRTIHRNYGELQRLKARLRASPPDDLYTRAVYRARIEQLEAVVDLASGGYLTAQESRSP